MIEYIPLPLKLLIGIKFFSLIAITLICILIYLKTRMYYSLTYHKGIDIFQKAFFFFALSHIIILIEEIFRLYNISSSFEFVIFFGSIGLLQLLAFSYLFSSMFYKTVDEWKIYAITAIIIGIGIIFKSGVFIALYSLTLILSLGGISIYKLVKQRKSKVKYMHIVYFLIFLAWTIQILGRAISEYHVLFKAISILSFLAIFSLIYFIIFQKITIQKSHKTKEL